MAPPADAAAARKVSAHAAIHRESKIPMLSRSKRAYPMTSIGWVSIDYRAWFCTLAALAGRARPPNSWRSRALQQKEAGLQSLDKPWADTLTPSGRMVLTSSPAWPSSSAALIRQRTQDGLVGARKRGSPSAVRVSFAVISRTGPRTHQAREIRQCRRQNLHVHPANNLSVSGNGQGN